MIHHLSGIHETADYRTDTQICLYYNDENENYPPHWHTPFEVIMPVKNGYTVVVGEQHYELREGDILRPAVLITKEEFPDFHPVAQKLMLEIKEEYFLCEPYYETAIYSRFMRILVDIGRLHGALKHPVSDASNSRQKDYLDKFLYITNYINEHFAENLSLEQVADLAGFSKYHFTRLFKQYTDTSFYKYLNQKRIDYAKTLLLDPDLPVIDVALQCGFSSLSAFLRMFKQLNKCTPTEFRNMYDY